MTEQPKISDEAVRVGADALHASYCYSGADDECCGPSKQQATDARIALATAYPLLRQQWEAEIAKQNDGIAVVIAEGIAREIDVKAEKMRTGADNRATGAAMAALVALGAEIARAAGERLSRPNGTEASDA